ncbi:hypothetical protein IV511_19070 [Enterobacter quasihormaechei]|uniref:hypothetical protein n=1 Tax=Enterobacter quasihormaechei TaxID=2529382 RepID=UPI002F4010BB
MKNRYIIMIIATLLLCVAVLVYVRTANENRVAIECFSVFTKDIENREGMDISGEMYLKLEGNGTGMFYINSSNSGDPIYIAKRTYYFKYNIDNESILNAELIEVRKTPPDNVDDKTFIRFFQNIRFKSSGNLTLSKFKNIYVIKYPGFIVHTCTPA